MPFADADFSIYVTDFITLYRFSVELTKFKTNLGY